MPAANQPQGPNPAGPSLGHPIHAFIDTSVFEDLNFAFDSPLFAAFLDRVDAGDIRLILPEITQREVSLRMTKLAKEAETGLAHAKRLALVLGDPLEPLNDLFDWQRLQKRLDKLWSRFVKHAKVETISVMPEDGPEVVRDYFATKPPFAGGRKKSEFPDAFVIAALRRFAKERGCVIAVVSGDKDFSSACQSDPALAHFPDLPKLLQHIASLDDVEPQEVRALLSQHRNAMESEIVKAFADRGFYWDSNEGHDSEVVETYDEDLQGWDISVIGIRNGWADVAGKATISFRASATYPDPDMMFKNDETKEWSSIGNVTATLFATVVVPISFRVSAKKLKKKELRHSDIVINNGGDIWFTEDEIEDVERPDYSR